MNLDDIPNGIAYVIDTNVLIYAEQGMSQQAQRLLRRIQSLHTPEEGRTRFYSKPRK